MSPRFRMTRLPALGHQAMLCALLATTSLGAAGLAFGPAVAQSSQSTSFNIPAGPLARALAAFGAQSGTPISYEAALANGLVSPGISGTASADAALARLLEGTGLSYRFTANGSAVIGRPAGPSGDAGNHLGTVQVAGEGGTGIFGDGMSAATPYETAASVSTTSGSAIRGANGSSAINALRSTPGAFTREVQGGGGIGVNLRGGEGLGRVNTMIDGVRQQNPFLGHYGNGGNVYLMPELLSGLDVSRGPVDGASGFNTLTGAVNFRTLDADEVLRPGRNQGVLSRLAYGDNGYNISRTLAAAMRFEEYGLTVMGAVARRVSDRYESGTLPNGRTRTRSASGESPSSGLIRLRWQPSEVHDFQFNATLYDLEATQAVTNDTYSLRYRYTPGSDLVDLRAHLYRNNYALSLMSGLTVTNDATGFEISNRSLLALGDQDLRLDYGFSWYRDDIGNYGTSSTSFEPGAYVPYGSGIRETGGIYANLGLSRGIFDVNLGLRYDHYGLDGLGGPITPGDPSTALRVDRSDWIFTPTLRVAARPTDWLEAYASYGRSYRAPTIAESLFSGFHGNWGSSFANPGLTGELSTGWEGGVNLRRSSFLRDGDQIALKLHYFDNEIEGYIVDGILQYTNSPGSTPNRGVEIQGSYDMGRAYLGLAYSNSSTGHPVAWGTGLTNSNYSRLPDEYWTLDAGLRFLEGRLVLGGRVRHVGASRFVSGMPARDLAVEAYRLTDLYANYTPNEQLSVFLSVENAEDTYYTPALDTFGPGTSSFGRGRTVIGGLNIRF